MPASIVNLASECRAPSDWLEFHPADWSAIHSATASALSCGPAAIVAVGQAPGAQHFCTRVTLSYSAAPAVSTLTIKDGTTVIYQAEISADARIVDLNFEKRPLRATPGASLTANVGSAGGAVVQTLTMDGFTINQGTQVSV